MSSEKNNQYPLFVSYYKTYTWILETMERMPRSIKFTLADRIIVISTVLLELIIETIYTKDKIELLIKMNLLYEKLRIFFRILSEQRHISLKQYAYISEQINECGKMTGGWIKLIKKP